MEDILQQAEQNTGKALELADKLGLCQAWKKYGGEVHFVGSLANGLYMDSRDIDLHVYTDPMSIPASFAAMAEIAARPGITQVTFANLLNTPEACLEWHAQYAAPDGRPWQLDIIHIAKGSRYDGYFEEQARRIKNALTPQTKRAVLEIKAALAARGGHIGGIWIYQAVLKKGVRTPKEFDAWYARQDTNRILEW